MPVAVAPIDGEIVDTLDDLAARANDFHQRGQQAERAALDYYVECGRALLQAKAQVKHGEWLPWLKENFSGSQPSAFRYMTLARNYSHVNNLVPGTSLREALDAVKPKPAPTEPLDKEPDKPGPKTEVSLREEKPWRFATEEPDEIQKQNWRTTFASFKAYTDVLAKGLSGDSRLQMLAYLRSLVKDMENQNVAP